MECELCCTGEPVAVYDLPTRDGVRSVCVACHRRYGRAPPMRRSQRTCRERSLPQCKTDHPGIGGPSLNLTTSDTEESPNVR
jgi:hypothetical protein